MLPVKIYTPTWRPTQFSKEENETKIKFASDLIDEARGIAHIIQCCVKQRAIRRYKSKVVLREMHKGNLVLKKVVIHVFAGKQLPKREGIYHLCQKPAHDNYKLEELDRRLIPITWNSISLIYYYC